MIEVISKKAKGWYVAGTSNRPATRSHETDPESVTQFIEVIDSELIRLETDFTTMMDPVRTKLSCVTICTPVS